MRHATVAGVLVVSAVLVASTWAVIPAGAGSPTTQVQFVHGIGTTAGDNPVDVYVAGGSAPPWVLVPGGPVAYTDTLEVGLVAGSASILLCDAVTDPAASVDACPDGGVNPGGTEVAVPETGPAVVVAGFGPPEGEPAITVDVFAVDAACLDAGEGRMQVAHASAMAEVTLFIDGERGDREPIGHGESVVAEVAEGDHGVRLVTVGDEFFVLDEPAVAAPGGETTLLALVGPGDPTPLDPATTDLRLVALSYQVEPCPVATVPSTSPSSTVPEPDPGPAAPPQPDQPDFTG